MDAEPFCDDLLPKNKQFTLPFRRVSRNNRTAIGNIYQEFMILTGESIPITMKFHFLIN